MYLVLPSGHRGPVRVLCPIIWPDLQPEPERESTNGSNAPTQPATPMMIPAMMGPMGFGQIASALQVSRLALPLIVPALPRRTAESSLQARKRSAAMQLTGIWADACCDVCLLSAAEGLHRAKPPAPTATTAAESDQQDPASNTQIAAGLHVILWKH